jgi:hypothetical protein
MLDSARLWTLPRIRDSCSQDLDGDSVVQGGDEVVKEDGR